jgi:hypothetical protein
MRCSERGRAGSVDDSDVQNRPRGSVPYFCEMKIHLTILTILLMALCACRRAEHQADASKAEAPGIEVLSEITFQVEDPENRPDGPSPYVNLADPEKDLKRMRGSDEIVFTATELIVVLDYPLREEFSFPISASSSKGFTRAELVRKIADLYKRVYEEEARTSKIPVIPTEQREGLINRNETNGKYGIWGHDLDDLILHTIEISRTPDGTVRAHFGIDS